jgi:hypothetical protein
MHPVHGGVGRVFVEYVSLDEAKLAQRSIAGKLFAGRTVITSFLFEDILHPERAKENGESHQEDEDACPAIRDKSNDHTEEAERRSVENNAADGAMNTAGDLD